MQKEGVLSLGLSRCSPSAPPRGSREPLHEHARCLWFGALTVTLTNRADALSVPFRKEGKGLLLTVVHLAVHGCGDWHHVSPVLCYSFYWKLVLT